MNQITFPIVLLSTKNEPFTLINGNDIFCTSNRLAFKSGNLVKLRFIDSNGVEYRTISAKKIKTIISFPDILFFNPFIKVEYQFDKKTKKHKLADFKELILKSLKKDTFMFKSMAGYNYSGTKRKVENAQSIQEIMNELAILCGYESQ